MKLRSLYVKFSITTIIIMIVSWILDFMYSNFYYQQKLKQQNDEKNTTIALDIANYIESHENIELDDYLQHIATVGYQIFFTDLVEDTIYGASLRDDSLYNETIVSDI